MFEFDSAQLNSGLIRKSSFLPSQDQLVQTELLQIKDPP